MAAHPAEPSLFICGLGIDAVQPEDEPWTIVHVGAVATEVVALSLDGEAVPFDEATGAFVAVARRATGEPAVLRATTATGRDERLSCVSTTTDREHRRCHGLQAGV